MKLARLDRTVLTALLSSAMLLACPSEKKEPPAAEPGAAVAPSRPNADTATTARPVPSGAQPEAPASGPSGALDKGSRPETRDQIDPDGIIRRGVALSADPAKPLSEIVKAAAGLDGKPVKLTGRVESVCQRKGCWMELHGDAPDERVRITARDYGFFVPQVAIGKTATVEGVLSVKTLSPEEIEHLAKESPSGVKPSEKEIAIVASGLELRAS